MDHSLNKKPCQKFFVGVNGVKNGVNAAGDLSDLEIEPEESDDDVHVLQQVLNSLIWHRLLGTEIL